MKSAVLATTIFEVDFDCSSADWRQQSNKKKCDFIDTGPFICILYTVGLT